MFVKLYCYRIKPGKEQEFINIQREAEKIYSRFKDNRTVFLKSKEDATKWVEVQLYQDEESYNDMIKTINEGAEIKLLFRRFLEVVISVEGLSEENFNQIVF